MIRYKKDNKRKHYPNDLTHARRRMGLSRKHVQKMIQLTKSTIQRYEGGTMLPPLITAIQLEIIYRIPVAYLFPQLYMELREQLRAEESLLLRRQASHRLEDAL